MLRKIAFAIAGGALALGSAVPLAAQDYTPYEQCVIERCIGNYPGDPVGYERCRRGCAAMYPPQAMPLPDAKLD